MLYDAFLDIIPTKNISKSIKNPMFNRKLLISAIVFGGTFFGVSFSAQAAPENQDVFFNGTYTSGCQFTEKTDGTVTPNALFNATSLGSTTTYVDTPISGEVKVICSSLLGAQVTASETGSCYCTTRGRFFCKPFILRWCCRGSWYTNSW